MEKEFGPLSKFKLEIVTPIKPLLSVVEGAAYFGITRHYIKGRVLNRTYGVKMNITVDEAKKLGISDKAIEANRFFNDYKKKEFIRNYFQVLASKDAEIFSGQVIQRRCYRKSPKQS